MQNRSFKVSNLKHILDVEMKDDVVIVTYARHEMEDMPEVEEAMRDDEDLEEDGYKDPDEEDRAMEDDDLEEDDDKEKKFLTQQERAFLSALLS